MVQSKNIQPLSLDDARQTASENIVAMSDDILLIDDLRRMDFEWDAFRLGFMAFTLCTNGSADFRINAKNVHAEAGDLVIGVGDRVLSDLSVSDDFHAGMILISTGLLHDGIAGLHQLWPFLPYLYEHPVIRLNEEECGRARACFDEVRRRLQMRDHHYRRESIEALIRLVYFDVCDLLSRHCNASECLYSGGYSLFERFLQLLDENFRSERNLAWYSERLCITPKYLSEVVKAVSGRTAGRWITDFVVLEAKQLLRGTSLSVKEIAQRLNFPNQSFLGKYFRNATGVSPSDYRRRPGDEPAAEEDSED